MNVSSQCYYSHCIATDRSNEPSLLRCQWLTFHPIRISTGTTEDNVYQPESVAIHIGQMSSAGHILGTSEEVIRIIYKLIES